MPCRCRFRSWSRNFKYGGHPIRRLRWWCAVTPRRHTGESWMFSIFSDVSASLKSGSPQNPDNNQETKHMNTNDLDFDGDVEEGSFLKRNWLALTVGVLVLAGGTSAAIALSSKGGAGTRKGQDVMMVQL